MHVTICVYYVVIILLIKEGYTMTRVISISQNKGGVLKTSLVVNFSGIFAMKRKKRV